MPALSAAVDEFLAEGVWEVKEMFRNNNGLTADIQIFSNHNCDVRGTSLPVKVGNLLHGISIDA
jgi:hypothetical protein